MDVRRTELGPLAQLIRLTNTSVDIGTAAPSNMPPASREPIGTFGEHRRYPLQTRSVTMSNPKTEPTDNAKKDPDEWLSGDDPMTGAQASYLKTLCEQAGTPEAFNDNLTKAEASKLIDEMREKAGVR
jgi:hypothetical protein